MEQREKINTKEILRASQMGMWCVEMEEGKPPRFYADEVMDELLGIDRDITTAANRMARQFFPDAVTGKDVVSCLKKLS